MRVVVLGAGAIGAFVGVRVAVGGKDVDDLQVVLIGRQRLVDDVRANGDAIRTRPLSYAEDARLVEGTRLRITTDMQQAADADVVLVAVKSGQTEQVAHELARVLAGNGGKSVTIVSLQNGLGNPQVLSKILGEAHNIVPGMVGFNVVWGVKASFNQTTSGDLYMSEIGPHVEPLCRLMQAGAIRTVVQKDIVSIQYGKLMINLNNAVNALSGVPILQMIKDPAYRSVIRASIIEARQVLSKVGIEVKSPGPPLALQTVVLGLPNFLFALLQPFFIKIDATAKASMLIDLESNKPTEIDFLNGHILQVAKDHGLPEPPINAAIIRLVRQAEQQKVGSPCLSGQQLRQACDLA